MEINNDSTSTSYTSDGLRGAITKTSPTTIEAPKNIIQTVLSAKSLYYNYRTSHLKRIDLYSEIEGLFAGNPPYNPADLAKNRLSHIANFNNLDARALYERGALAYWNLLNEAQNLCKFTIRGDFPDLVAYADILSSHWTAVVRSWPSFNVAYNTLTAQIVKFGLSPILWPDERDWRWRTIELPRFFVEDQAQTDLELVTCIFVESIFTAQYLYDIYLQFKDTSPKDCPWNIKELTALLVWAANSDGKTSTYADMMDIQRRLQNLDISFSQIFSDSIRLVSMFYLEYNEEKSTPGVSHFMFHPRFDNGHFLYHVPRQYKCMEEGVTVFTASPGEFTLHSNRGLGHKIFSGAQAMMQLDCSIIDMARMSSTPLIKTLSSGAKEFDSIRFYPGVPTNIGATEVVENKLGENIQQLIGASQFMLGKLQFNTANSGDDPSMPDRDQGSISPSQARMQSYKEFSVLKNNIAHFYTQLDKVFQNMTIKMLHSRPGDPGHHYVKTWKDRCIADGVPPEVFAVQDEDYFGMPSQLAVCATRVAGDGSTLARIMGLQELQVISGDFGPREAREYKRQWIMATMGAEYVPAFLQDSDNADEQAGGASLAGLENNDMVQGQSPIFSADNEQRSHFVTHLALGNNIIQKIQQQEMSAIDADKVFTVLVPHMAEHFEALKKSPFTQNFLQKVVKSWNQLSEYARLNRKNAAQQLQAQIRKQKEQQAQTEQILSDEQLKNLQVQGKEKRDTYKVQAQVARADRANESRAEIMKDKVKLDAENDRLKISLENKTASGTDTANGTTKSLPELRQDLQVINGSTISPYDMEIP